MLLIRTRLAVALVIILAIVLTTFSVVIYQITRSSLLSEVERDVRQRATTVAQASTPPPGRQAVRLPPMDVFHAPDTYIQIRAPNGRILATSGNLGNRALPLIQSAIRSHQVVEAHLGGVPLFVCARPIMSHGHVLGYAVVARTPRTIYQALQRLRQLLYPSAATALVLSGLVVWLLVWRSMRPLARLDATAAEIASSQDHTRRVPLERRHDEIGRLARSINSMLRALDDAYRQVQNVSDLQRQFLFDRFYRAANTRHLPGMGLGLAIARHIVEQHGGAIRVESEPGHGSRFTVSFPLSVGS